MRLTRRPIIRPCRSVGARKLKKQKQDGVPLAPHRKFRESHQRSNPSVGCSRGQRRYVSARRDEGAGQGGTCLDLTSAKDVGGMGLGLAEAAQVVEKTRYLRVHCDDIDGALLR
jgi:hypothetical protein